MNEIKVRAWDEENKKMVYGTLDDMLEEIVSENSHHELVDLHYRNNFETKFMQYIRLKDKNDEEIYTGDFIHLDWTFGGEEVIVRIYQEESGEFKGVVVNPKAKHPYVYNFYEIKNKLGKYKVGNIYENPELEG